MRYRTRLSEQTSWLLFLKYLDGLEQDRATEAQLEGRKYTYLLDRLYEEKIKRMGNAGRNGGEQYTPRPLIRAMIRVVSPKLGQTLYDGAYGSAGFLCEAFDYLRQAHPRRTTAQDKALQERTFYGKEKKSLAYVIGIMNLILHGIEAPNRIS